MTTQPIKEGDLVEGMRPSCACRGAKLVPFRGVVKKVITGRNGVWYYLDTGVTVPSAAIKTNGGVPNA